MKILVTGCAGFIGFHITERIMDRGHSVVGIDNMNEYYDLQLKKDRLKLLKKSVKDSNSRLESQGQDPCPDKLKFYKGNIADFGFLEKIVKKHKPDMILNLAAQAGVRYSLEAPFVYHESNLTGFMNILEIARQFKLPVIYASSSSVYGNRKDNYFSEVMYTDEPVSLYAATKKSNEILAYSYAKLYKVPLIGLRFFTVYGPYGRPDMAIFKFTKKILKGETIDVYNKGKMHRDFTYIDDIVEGIWKTIDYVRNDRYSKKVPYDIFNLGRGSTRELIDFVKIIEKECGVSAKINFMPMQKGDVLKTSADTTRAKREIGYHPHVDLEEGVARFVSWYRKYYKFN